MRKIFYSTLLLLSPAALSAQTAAEWQSQHPNGVVISANTYAHLTSQELSMLGSEVFVLDPSTPVHDKSTSENSGSNPPVSGKDQAVKAWKDNHVDIMIVPRSDYENADNADRELMAQLHALILAGETITFDDISNYPY